MQAIRRKIDSYYQLFPSVIRKFLVRSFILFVVWKCFYLFLFSEKRIIDRPLTELVSNQAVNLLNIINHSKEFISRPSFSIHETEGLTRFTPTNLILFKDHVIIVMLDSCNGLELLVLYVGFIIAMPAVWHRKFFFSVFGIILIHVMNLLRCVGLAELAINWHNVFDIAHHYVFKVIIYATIFFLWHWFCKKIDLSKY